MSDPVPTPPPTPPPPPDPSPPPAPPSPPEPSPAPPPSDRLDRVEGLVTGLVSAVSELTATVTKLVEPDETGNPLPWTHRRFGGK